jgi:hypothetical protein
MNPIWPLELPIRRPVTLSGGRMQKKALKIASASVYVINADYGHLRISELAK